LSQTRPYRIARKVRSRDSKKPAHSFENLVSRKNSTVRSRAAHTWKRKKTERNRLRRFILEKLSCSRRIATYALLVVVLCAGADASKCVPVLIPDN